MTKIYGSVTQNGLMLCSLDGSACSFVPVGCGPCLEPHFPHKADPFIKKKAICLKRSWLLLIFTLWAYICECFISLYRRTKKLEKPRLSLEYLKDQILLASVMYLCSTSSPSTHLSSSQFWRVIYRLSVLLCNYHSHLCLAYYLQHLLVLILRLGYSWTIAVNCDV